MVALAWVLLIAAPATAVELNGPLTQGGLIIGTAAPGTAVAFEGRALRVDPRSGTFVFGIGRDQGPEAALAIIHPDGREETQALAIAPRQWQIERVDGLPPSTVTPPPEVLKRIRREGALINAARARDSTRKSVV